MKPTMRLLRLLCWSMILTLVTWLGFPAASRWGEAGDPEMAARQESLRGTLQALHEALTRAGPVGGEILEAGGESAESLVAALHAERDLMSEFWQFGALLRVRGDDGDNRMLVQVMAGGTSFEFEGTRGKNGWRVAAFRRSALASFVSREDRSSVHFVRAAGQDDCKQQDLLGRLAEVAGAFQEKGDRFRISEVLTPKARERGAVLSATEAMLSAMREPRWTPVLIRDASAGGGRAGEGSVRVRVVGDQLREYQVVPKCEGRTWKLEDVKEVVASPIWARAAEPVAEPAVEMARAVLVAVRDQRPDRMAPLAVIIQDGRLLGMPEDLARERLVQLLNELEGVEGITVGGVVEAQYPEGRLLRVNLLRSGELVLDLELVSVDGGIRFLGTSLERLALTFGTEWPTGTRRITAGDRK